MGSCGLFTGVCIRFPSYETITIRLIKSLFNWCMNVCKWVKWVVGKSFVSAVYLPLHRR